MMVRLFNSLDHEARLLLQADLQPLQGERFQPTGFPNLGEATYQLPNGPNKLLVESNQSIANRLEAVCWDENSRNWVSPLQGLPFIRVLDKNGEELTNSLLEAHRLNSGYILFDKSPLIANLLHELDIDENDKKPIDIRKVAAFAFRYDINAILHGLFISRKEIGGGRCRLTRLLTGFIEATNVRPVESGGVKNDRVDPTGPSKEGLGNVPFARTEYVAEEITAYFNLDLAGLRSYNLGQQAEDLLIGLALWKIHAFLANGLRLRTACDLKVKGIKVTRPKDHVLPRMTELEEWLPGAINEVTALFADPVITEVTYTKK